VNLVENLPVFLVVAVLTGVLSKVMVTVSPAPKPLPLTLTEEVGRPEEGLSVMVAVAA
jgi:hypothetical protein